MCPSNQVPHVMPKHWFGGSQRALQVMGITVQARGIGLGHLPKCSYSWDGCTAFPSGCRKCKDSHYFIPWAAGTWQAGVPIKAGTRGWDRDIPGRSSHPARGLVKLGCCLSSAPAATSSRGNRSSCPAAFGITLSPQPRPASPGGCPAGIPAGGDGHAIAGGLRARQPHATEPHPALRRPLRPHPEQLPGRGRAPRIAPERPWEAG